MEISGAVGGFYKLADGRGYVKMAVDGAISWEKVDTSNAPRRTAQLDVSFLDQLLMNELDSLVGWNCYRLLTALVSDLDATVDLFQPTGDAGTASGEQRGWLMLLLKIAGLGKLKSTKSSSRKADIKGDLLKNTPLLRAVKRLVAAYGTKCASSLPSAKSTSNVAVLESCFTPADAPTGSLPPMILALVSIVSGLLNSQARFALQKGGDKDSKPTAPAAPQVAKPVVIESEHDYENNTDSLQHVFLPGAAGIEITFDEDCSTEVSHCPLSHYTHLIYNQRMLTIVYMNMRRRETTTSWQCMQTRRRGTC